MRGRIIVNVIEDPKAIEPKIILETEGNVMGVDALIGFGKILDRLINGPIPLGSKGTWRRSGEDFDQAALAGKQILSGSADEAQRSNRQAGLIRSVIDDILKESGIVVVLAGGSHVDS